MSQQPLKIDPRLFPAIILAAFVIGLVLAVALGFGPQRGGRGEGGHSQVSPALVLVWVAEESDWL